MVMLLWFECFFFFKQKTAYEMRISDWSSDVCSSDLHPDDAGTAEAAMHLDAPFRQLGRHHVAGALLLEAEFGMGVQVAPPFGHLRRELGDAVDDRHEVLRVAGERRAEYRAVGLLLQPDTQPANRPQIGRAHV